MVKFSTPTGWLVISGKRPPGRGLLSHAIHKVRWCRNVGKGHRAAGRFRRSSDRQEELLPPAIVITNVEAVLDTEG